MQVKLENMLKILENNLTKSSKKKYDLLKCDLNEIYDKVAEGTTVQIRCKQCEKGEVYSNIFSIWKQRKLLENSL